MKIKDIFYINLHLKDRLDIEFTAFYCELMPRGSADISFTISDARTLFCGSSIVIEVRVYVTLRISNTNE